MLLARVEGNAIATVAHPSLKGWRMLLCQPIGPEGHREGAPLLAIDDLGAGLHQTVLVTSDGKSIREKVGHPLCPLRFMTIGVIDDPVPRPA